MFWAVWALWHRAPAERKLLRLRLHCQPRGRGCGGGGSGSICRGPDIHMMARRLLLSLRQALQSICPDARKWPLHEIRTDNLTFSRKIQVAQSRLMMRLSATAIVVRAMPASRGCWFQSRWIRCVLTALGLPRPGGFRCWSRWFAVAISYGEARAISFVDVARRQGFPGPDSGEIGLVRFNYSNSSLRLIAASACFRFTCASRVSSICPWPGVGINCVSNADGGQLFVTGEGMEQ